MEYIELARKFQKLGAFEDAQQAYMLYLGQSERNDIFDYEVACFLLMRNMNRNIALSILINLYKVDNYKTEVLKLILEYGILVDLPDIEMTYRKNVEALENYPYLFRKDFPKFEDLNKRFVKYDENGFISFDSNKLELSDYLPVNQKKITRYFFKNLDNPIIQENLFSQYEIEYLFDMVRPSEFIARDNHIYLYYHSFEEFASYLQVIDFTNILNREKFVFLFDDQKDMYPIDFKEKYGIDYTTKNIKPINIHEIKKIIIGVQLSAHNGGDFFNEIIDGHPNVICAPSLILDDVEFQLNKSKKKKELKKECGSVLLTNYILNDNIISTLNPGDRIVPAVYFQPHFHNIRYWAEENDYSILAYSKQVEQIENSIIFDGFKYVKSFSPIRRVTNSYAATIRFFNNHDFNEGSVMGNELGARLLNKGFYRNPNSKFMCDCVSVRFEDGKLNPKATFTALAEFLDIPYTQSMTYCSKDGELNPESLKGNYIGFDTKVVNNEYCEFAGNGERKLLEIVYRDVMNKYGYDFKYAENREYSYEELLSILDEVEVFKNQCIKFAEDYFSETETKEAVDIIKLELWNKYYLEIKEQIRLFSTKKKLVDNSGVCLEILPLLKPKDEFLEQSLYR